MCSGVYPENPLFQLSETVNKLVEGKLGIKTGEGFEKKK